MKRNDVIVSIKGLSKASVFQALYNNAQTRMGFDITPLGMTIEHASEITQRHSRFEWFNGRNLKISIYGNWVDPTDYDTARMSDCRLMGLGPVPTFRELIAALRYNI